MATELIESLRAEGAVDSVGRFTLDPAKAREKLQKFQLVDAHRYVLELVQAAVLRGATDIAFEIDADDMRMRFDGATFTAAELADVWGAIFADGEGRLLGGVRQLALGLNAALGLGPKRIVVRSGDQELRLAPGAADGHTTLAEAVAETTIHVVQRVRLAGLGLFFKNLVGSLPEEVHLRERCVYARAKITLDGKRISDGPHVAGALGSCAIEGPGVGGLVAVCRSDAPAELRLIKDGVWIDARELPGCGPGVLAIVEGEGLRKDVSLAKIVADETLAAVTAEVQAARWTALAEVAELARTTLGQNGELGRLVRAEVLRFMVLAEVPAGRGREVLLSELRWQDARTYSEKKHQVQVALSLRDLVGALEPGIEGEPPMLRFAERMFGGLAAEGRPIPFVHEDERVALARVLGCVLVPAASLEADERRAKARRRFLLRTATGRLPGERHYAIRRPFAGEGLRGEIGVRMPGPGEERPVITEATTWLCREGRVLAALKLDWGIPGLEVDVEGPFEPTEEYDDAVRDAAVVQLGLRVLAAVRGVLVGLTVGQREELAAGVRGLDKTWLQLVFDAEARASLWRRLRVPKELWPDEATVRAALPGPERLLVEDRATLGQLKLFEDFDGARRSLDELAWRFKRKGQLDEIDRSVGQEPGMGSEVLWLGRGDRAILAGVFGAQALKSWQPTLASWHKERAFRARRPESIGAAARRLRTQLPAAAGHPDSWCRIVEEDGVQAAVLLARGRTVPTQPEELRRAEVELFVHERRVVKRTLDLGVGPIVAAANFAELRPNAGWDDVADDEALALVTTVVARAAWALLAEAAATVVDTERWLAELVVRRLALPDRAEVAAFVPTLETTPLVGTVTGERISVAAIEAAVRRYKKIGWVLTTTADAPISDPPVLRERRGVIEGVRALIGAALVEGDARVRQREVGGRLAALPEVAEVRLDPDAVWHAVSLDSGSPKLEGEIGLCRGRTSGGLHLTLCTQGKRVALLEEASVEVACEAIVADPQLPLTAEALVDARNKRYGQYVKRCRRAVYGLVVGLCERWSGLDADEQAQARALLLRFVAAERRFGEVRREARQVAWDAATKLPLLVDVWGQARSLAEVEARLKGRTTIEVVRTPVQPPAGSEPGERIILRVDEVAEACLAGVAKIAALDHRWQQESAALTELAAAPKFVPPDVQKEAWIDRQATIAGGLQAHLWIPRRPGAADGLVFTRADREVGRMVVFDGVRCAGVVRGEGLVVDADGVRLDERQRVSLAKHVCMLVEGLARQIRGGGGRVPAAEREAVRRWLVDVTAAFDRADPALLAGLGKAFTQLRTVLLELASPAMRTARAGQREVAKPAEVKVAEVKPAEVTAPVVFTPEQQLLAAVRAELAWARERHGSLLERLRLDRLAIGSGRPGIAAFDAGLVLQREHPLVARQLARLERGEGVDPVELMFVVSAVYTRMNAVAEEIGASDEQAFVARLAEGLALAYG